MNKQCNAENKGNVQKKKLFVRSELCDYLHPSIQYAYTVLVGSGYCFRCGTSMYKSGCSILIRNICAFFFSSQFCTVFAFAEQYIGCVGEHARKRRFGNNKKYANNKIGKSRARAIFFLVWPLSCYYYILIFLKKKKKKQENV